MYAYFYGTVMEKGNDAIVLGTDHIGYNIFMPAGMIAVLPPEGEQVKIYTYTCVREDALLLYGFLTKEDLNLFKLLITVSGIGPKVALGILSVMDCETIKLAILSQDAKMIAKAPGIGSKTAGRLILELKDKIKIEDLTEGNAFDTTSSENTMVRNEASEALVSLGYSVSDAYRVLNTIEITAQTKVEDVIKTALKKMI